MSGSYPGVTPITRILLQHWAAKAPLRDDPMFFCQREAAETAIWLAEVAGRGGVADFRDRIDPENLLHNEGLPRVALKMATGSGKTVVMAMLIAWQTINKVMTPRDSRFSKRFLVVTPGITIRDRLRVLLPAEPDNYYKERDIVPAGLWHALNQAHVVITNYHAFLPRQAKEMQGVAANTKKFLRGGSKLDPFTETDDQVVARVLRSFGGGGNSKSKGGAIIVLNDEAHHCYRDKPLEDAAELDSEEKKEAKARNEGARVWYHGLKAIHRKIGIKAAYDLSATPYYLSGSGYNSGFIFPWTVSDFSLMDAIESGIVKVPRIPVDDDAAGSHLTYKHLWDYVGPALPKKKGVKAAENWVIPNELEGALHSLYRSYEGRYENWRKTLEALGEPPPVMIVVCPNTIVSKLVYQWIGGETFTTDEGFEKPKSGAFPLFSNVEDGVWLGRPRTILVDSAQLESGEGMKSDFREAAAHEIQAFKNDMRRRNSGLDVDTISDEDILREVMNTVGKKGRLGEPVRCVVSVSMLTEGWDANTVTHILGIRRFASQLLCEQVVGRGLRRRSYALNEDGRFDPEYADVYGVPFAFIPGKPTTESPPLPPAMTVQSLPSRANMRIEFPKLDGYRLEIPDQEFFASFDETVRLHVDQQAVALWVKNEGIVGTGEEIVLEDLRSARPQAIAYAIASRLLKTSLSAHDGVERPWLFPQVAALGRKWVDECVTLEGETPLGMLLLAEGTNLAAEKFFGALVAQEGKGSRHPRLLPMLRPFDSVGSTDDVYFMTRKNFVDVERSHVNRVVADSGWESTFALMLERASNVAFYVKNDHLDFSIPYVFEGRSYRYVPDFIIRLEPLDGDIERTLIVEISGELKHIHTPGPVAAKADTAQFQWCASVNNHGGFGRWGYIEIHDMKVAEEQLRNAIENLYADGTVTGLRDIEEVGV